MARQNYDRKTAWDNDLAAQLARVPAEYRREISSLAEAFTAGLLTQIRLAGGAVTRPGV